MTQPNLPAETDSYRNLSWIEQIPYLPVEWQLCAVNNNKQPYHPDSPSGAGWQEKGFSRERFKSLNGRLAAIGLLTGRLSGGIVALDHDGYSADEKIAELSGLPAEQAIPPTVGFTSQRDGRYQLLYQVPADLWECVTTRKYPTKAKALDSGKGEALEFRWDGAQSVILGAHPSTSGYRWLDGRSPWEIEIAPAPDWIIMAMRDETPDHIAIPRSNWQIERPLETPIPLRNLATKAHQGYIDNGASEGRRNDAGAALARDLIGCQQWATASNVYFEGDAQSLFWQFAQRSGLSEKETKTIWRSAGRKNPEPSCSDEGLKAVIKAWQRKTMSKEIKRTGSADEVFQPQLPQEAKEKGSKQDQRPKREDYFESIGDLVSKVDSVRELYGFETPGYRLALYKMAMASGIQYEKIMKLYYAAKMPETHGKIVNSLEIASEPEEEEKRWIFPDLLPQCWVSVFYASGGTGKTRLCHQLAHAAVTGTEFLTEYKAVKPTKTLFIQIDEGTQGAKTTIKNEPKLQHENLDFWFSWSSQQIDQLRQSIIENEYGLIIIDSLMAAQRDSGLDIKDASYGNIIREFQAIANQVNCSFVVLHHTNRAGEFTGNNSIKDSASVMWELRRYDEVKDPHKLKQSERIFDIGNLKTRGGKPNQLLLNFDEDEGNFTYQANYTKLLTPEEPATWSERIQLFFNANPERGFTFEDLVNSSVLNGLTLDTAKKTCRRLRDRGLLITQPRATASGQTALAYFSAFSSIEKSQKAVPSVLPSAETLIEQEKKEVTAGGAIGGTACLEGGTGLDTQEERTGKPSYLDCPPPVPSLEPLPTLENEQEGTTAHTHRPPEIDLEKRFAKSSDKPKASRAPLASYTGPEVGAQVRFVADDLSAAERSKLRSKGIEYPWGHFGIVMSHAAAGQGYNVVVQSGQKTFVVTNLLAIEKTKAAPRISAPEITEGQEF